MIEKCSCDEARHLRAAMARILAICTSATHQNEFDDLAEIAGIAECADKLEPLPATWTEHTP